MNTTLAISFVSIIFPLIAAIIFAKGPRKYKSYYIGFLFISIGLTVGLFINHIVASKRKEVTHEVMSPRWIYQGETFQIGDIVSCTYLSYWRGNHSVVCKGRNEQKHIELVVPGQSVRLDLEGQDYILDYIQENPLANDAVEIKASLVDTY